MCGRCSEGNTQEQIAAFSEPLLSEQSNLQTHFNIRPTDTVQAIIRGGQGREVGSMRWASDPALMEGQGKQVSGNRPLQMDLSERRQHTAFPLGQGDGELLASMDRPRSLARLLVPVRLSSASETTGRLAYRHQWISMPNSPTASRISSFDRTINSASGRGTIFPSLKDRHHSPLPSHNQNIKSDVLSSD